MVLKNNDECHIFQRNWGLWIPLNSALVEELRCKSQDLECCEKDDCGSGALECMAVQLHVGPSRHLLPLLLRKVGSSWRFFQYLVFNMGLGHLHMTLCPHLRPAKSPSPSRSPTSLSISRYIKKNNYTTSPSLHVNHCLGTLASPPSPLSHEILGILPISTEKPTRGVHITRFKVSMNGSKPWCLGWSHNIYIAE